MRAVKDGLPVPYGESEEAESPRQTRVVRDLPRPLPERESGRDLETLQPQRL